MSDKNSIWHKGFKTFARYQQEMKRIADWENQRAYKIGLLNQYWNIYTSVALEICSSLKPYEEQFKIRIKYVTDLCCTQANFNKNIQICNDRIIFNLRVKREDSNKVVYSETFKPILGKVSGQELQENLNELLCKRIENQESRIGGIPIRVNVLEDKNGKEYIIRVAVPL